jgi:hypothetical protein
MQRFSRSHVLCIWCCAFLVIFAYVLFDLLDIDGSDFDRTLGSCTAVAERLAGDEGGRHIAAGQSTAWLAPRHDRWTMGGLATTPTVSVAHSFLPHGRPRAALPPQGTASNQLESDPARPSAEP